MKGRIWGDMSRGLIFLSPTNKASNNGHKSHKNMITEIRTGFMFN